MASKRGGYAIACLEDDAIWFDECSMGLRLMTQEDIDNRLGKGYDQNALDWQIEFAYQFISEDHMPVRHEPGWTVYWADITDGGNDFAKALEAMCDVAALDCPPPLGEGGYIWTEYGPGECCPSTSEPDKWNGHPDRVRD